LAPELALGVLQGDERADALRHLATCAECRAHVDELADVADSLLLLAPAADPPLGFESRVIARVSAPAPAAAPRTWVRTALVAAAAAIVAMLATMTVVRDDGDPVLRATLASTRSGDPVGRVWAYDGARDWMFMTIDNPWAADHPYLCEAVLRDGRTVTLGRFQANDGKGAWGEPVRVPVRDIETVRVLTDGGDVVASATLDD
jgi:anti-sigma-K factor RskA